MFVEKPLAYSIGEGRAMVNAALKHKRITQMGNHIHNDRPTYRRAVEVIRSGALGTIHRVDCSLVVGSNAARQGSADGDSASGTRLRDVARAGARSGRTIRSARISAIATSGTIRAGT